MLRLYQIKENECISCGTCKEYCKSDAIIERKKTGYATYFIDINKCVGCGICAVECLNECIVRIK